MVTSGSASGKSNSLTSITLIVLNEDVLFSVQQDSDTKAIPPPLRPSCGL